MYVTVKDGMCLLLWYRKQQMSSGPYCRSPFIVLTAEGGGGIDWH